MFESIDSFAAFESMLCDECVNQLLEQVQQNVDATCKTVEDCDAMAEKVKVETAKFNECLETMAEAAKAFKAGAISKEEMTEKVTPCINELKQSCDVLKIDSCCDDAQDIADDDITNLRAFIVGVAEIVAKKKETMLAPPPIDEKPEGDENTMDDDTDKTLESDINSLIENDIEVNLESLIESLNDTEGETPATESSIGFILREKFGFDAKEVSKLVKDADKMAKAKEYDGAIQMYKKAIAAYTKSLAKIKSIPDKHLAMVSRKKADDYVTDSVSKTAAINSFENKIFAIKNKIEACLNKKHAAAAKATESFDIYAELDISEALESALDIEDGAEDDDADLDDDETVPGLLSGD